MQAEAGDGSAEGPPGKDEWIARQGCGCMFYLVGVLVAAIWSLRLHHSVLLAAMHGSLSWLYVLYRLLFA